MNPGLSDIVGAIYKPLFDKMSNQAVKDSEFTDPIFSLIISNPARKIQFAEAAIKELEQYLARHKRNECREDGNCARDKQLKSIIIRFQLEKSNSSATGGMDAHDKVIHSQIIKGFEQLIDDRDDPKKRGVNENDFVNHVVKLIQRYSEKKEMIFEVALQELNFLLNSHREFSCPYANGKREGTCPFDKLIEDSITMIKYQYDTLINYKQRVSSQTEIAPKIIVPVQPVPHKKPEYINKKRIDELKNLKSDWDLDKLVQLCVETNSNWTNENYYSVIANVRMILHYVAPIFGVKAFKNLAEYDGGQSFKKVCTRLIDFIDIANIYAHQAATHKDPLPNESTADKISDVDVLLSKVISVAAKRKIET